MRFLRRVHLGLLVGVFSIVPLSSFGQRWMEHLDRGVVAVNQGGGDVFVSWRLLGTDPYGLGFNLYRSEDGGAAVRLNSEPLTAGTNYLDTTADLASENAYFVRPVLAGVEQEASELFVLPANAPVRQYLSVPLQTPDGGILNGSSYFYRANDASVGDLDGDGDYEIVLKWDPSNSRDNSQSGHTANTLLDAYDLDGTHLWRIDLGVNIRSGAHYTQFLVYDFDGDGRAEVACRTAEGSMDSTGGFIADPDNFFGTMPPIEHAADRRNTDGYILTGPEFLTIFDGATGVELATTNYVPQRHPDTLFPTGAQIGQIWGDTYGNRIDRFLAGVAYLDGRRPSLVMCRGYYTGQSGQGPGRTVLAAFDWRDGQLTQRWVFDTEDGYPNYRGQGNHQLTVGDVDGDGKDEIVYGACAIDDDGSGLYSTGLGHGDALHMSDMDPARPGLEVFMPHESPFDYGPNATEFRDARTGELIWGVQATGDIGRGMAADVDPRHPGYEMWASGGTGGMRTATESSADPTNGPRGTEISGRPSSLNFGIWWDGDLLREIHDGYNNDNGTETRAPYVDKWDWETESRERLLSADGCFANNWTKATPCLSGDILGDWREELVLRTAGNDELRIYTTIDPTEHRMPTLMHDPQYRLAIAWQNVGYNQPPHPGFFIGEGMAPAPIPDVMMVGADPIENTGRLANLSVRTLGGIESDTLILGFVVQGTGPQELLVRGIGPRLGDFGVPGFMPDPRIDLYNQANTSAPIGGNDDWSSAANADEIAATAAELFAFSLVDPSKDAALLASLSPAAYTAQIVPVSETPAIALAELYAVDFDGTTQLGNASARARVGTGAETFIVGFVIAGGGTMDLLIRAVGPGLEQHEVSGALSDVELSLFKRRPDLSWELVASNRDWIASSGVNAQTFARVFAFGLRPEDGDAAFRLRLPPGTYTAHATAVGGNGVGLVELFLTE